MANNQENEEIAVSILAVEDDEDQVLIISQILKALKQKYTLNCHVLKTGEEAEKQLKKIRYDLLILDQHLGSMKGTDLLAKAKDRNPKVSAIFYTSDTSSELLDRSTFEGARSILIKGGGFLAIQLAFRNAIEDIINVKKVENLNQSLKKYLVQINEKQKENEKEHQQLQQLYQSLIPKPPKVDTLQLECQFHQEVQGELREFGHVETIDGDNQIFVFLGRIEGEKGLSPFVMGVAQAGIKNVELASSLEKVAEGYDQWMSNIFKSDEKKKTYIRGLMVSLSKEGQLEILDAGYTTPLFIPLRGGITHLKTISQKPFGKKSKIFRRYESQKFQLEYNDRLLLYSPGFVDQGDKERRSQGEKRMEAQVKKFQKRGLSIIMKALFQSNESQFSGSNSLIMFHYQGNKPEKK